MRKDEVLNAFFASVFTGKPGFQESQASETRYLHGLHPQELSELAGVTSRPLLIISERLWKLGEVPEDWGKKKGKEKGKEKDPGNYRPGGLTSVPGKVIEQIILGNISKHMKDSRKCAVVAKRFSSFLVCIRKSAASRSDETTSGVLSPVLPHTRQIQTFWSESKAGPQRS